MKLRERERERETEDWMDLDTAITDPYLLSRMMPHTVSLRTSALWRNGLNWRPLLAVVPPDACWPLSMINRFWTQDWPYLTWVSIYMISQRLRISGRWISYSAYTYICCLSLFTQVYHVQRNLWLSVRSWVNMQHYYVCGKLWTLL